MKSGSGGAHKVLMILISADGESNPREIGLAIRPHGSNPESRADSARKVLRPLSERGLVAKVGPGRYRITERGRIAAALASARKQIFLRRSAQSVARD